MWKYRGQKRPPFAEQPEPGQESVWDYPRPPEVVPCNSQVEVFNRKNVIASSTATYRVLETASPPAFYIPGKDIDWTLLVPAQQQTFCEWKGIASYWALADKPDDTPVAWQYNEPQNGFEMLREYVSFYPARVACYVNNERVRPQYSEFYGGWVTNNIAGPFKGDPGTGNW
ncbi:MAG: DUF427 domain-containing protein [Gammaproteobacteria bacterium]|jgi:uncharacterized protein (DUF427 family)